jgi:hypothetical protein
MARLINRARRDSTRSSAAQGRACGCRLRRLAFQAPGMSDNSTQASDKESDGDAHARQEQDGRDGEAHRVRGIGELRTWLHDSTSG